MIKSSHCEHVYWVPDGALVQGETLDEGWYFFDEVGLIGSEAFETEVEALKEFEKYVDWLKRVECSI